MIDNATFSHIPQWIFDKLGFLEQCANSNQNFVELKLLKKGLLINNHQDLRHILYTNYHNYVKNPRLTDHRGRQLFGEGIQTRTAAIHKQQRRQIQPVFIPTTVAVFAPQVTEMAQAHLAVWSDGAKLDLAEEMLQLVHYIMGKILFGLDFEHRDRAFGKTILYRRQQVNHQFSVRVPGRDFFTKPSNIFQLQALPKIEAKIIRMIQARQQNLEGYQDILSMLVQIQLKAAIDISDQQLCDEALGTSGGYETIAAVLIWTLYLLSLHPQVEDKLLQELNSVLQQNCQQEPQNPLFDIRDISSLKYTKMVLEESLRLYPPTWIFTRMTQKLDHLPSGLTLAAGTKLYLSPYVLHRNPQYFSAPNKFDPERFNDQNKQLRPKFAYFPFGGGTRVCIGQPLVEMMTIVMLATIVKQIKFNLLPNQTIIPQPNITLLPKKGLKMQVFHRLKQI